MKRYQIIDTKTIETIGGVYEVFKSKRNDKKLYPFYTYRKQGSQWLLSKEYLKEHFKKV